MVKLKKNYCKISQHDIYIIFWHFIEKSLEVDQPKYGDCRNILRSGPASSLRVNIRAVS